MRGRMFSFPPFHMVDTVIDSVMFRDGNGMAQLSNPPVVAIILSFCGKLSQLIHSIPVPVMGGICILLFGVIATSGFRVLVESKVDYSKSSNLVMTSVIMIIGLSGAKISFGAFSVQGMVLATLVAIIMSLLFKLFAKLNLLNE